MKKTAIFLLVIYAIDLRAIDARPTEQTLPDSVLRHVIYTEPNLHIQLLGNVSFPQWLSLLFRAHIYLIDSSHTLQMQVSDLDGRLKRTFLYPAHRQAASLVRFTLFFAAFFF